MFYAIVVFLAWIFWHIGFRIRVIGRENIPKQGSFVLAPNHISAVDPVFVIIARFWGKKMVIMGKAELFRVNWFVSWFLRSVGVVAVERGKGDRDLVENISAECRKGRGLLIFPEGTRSKDGQLGKIKSGAFVVAAGACAPMIPCRIIYDTPTGQRRMFCRVRVCFGSPIPAEQLAMADGHDMQRLRENKALLKAAWEQLYEENKF